tara:strand:+ start:413 stop:1531 length:1119 start_codon:yes stop_codon:yes gene_type:complete
MKVTKLKVKTKAKNYNIFVGYNIINKLSSILKSENIKFDKCLIVIDKKVPSNKLKVLKKRIKCTQKNTFFINASEKNKNQTTVDNILRLLFTKKFNRNDCIISFGGGITGDVIGFVASIYKRGIKFINIPTTLLSQVDSSIGGKTGINNNFGKNLIGSFYQPDLVISDTSLLRSLPKRELICGYGEMLKHSLISNLSEFNYLNNYKFKILNLEKPFIEKAILRSCKIKKKVVELDDKEKSVRKKLNFGHTFAHAYEATTQYTKKLNHGEAVILGIISATEFSYYNNLLPKNILKKIIEHIESLEIDVKFHKYFNYKDITKIVNFMMNDKKNNSFKINLILLKNIGKPVINNNYDVNKIAVFLKRNLFKKYLN